MYIGNEKQLDGLVEDIAGGFAKAAGALNPLNLFKPAVAVSKAAAAALAKKAATAPVRKEIAPPSPMTSPLPPKAGPLPADQRQPASFAGRLIEKVFSPAVLSVVRSTAPGEAPQVSNAGQRQNIESRSPPIVDFWGSDKVVGPLGVPVSQPSVNYAQQPQPIIIQQQPSFPPWAIPAALGVGLLFVALGGKK